MSSGISGEFGPMRYSVILIAMTCAILHRRAKERLDRGERLERVMDQDVLVADLVEDRLRVLVVAPQAARRERRVLQLGTMKSRAAATSRRSPDDPVVRSTTSSVTSKFSTRMLSTRVGMSASTCSSEIAPRRSCLQAAIDALEQVVGLVFFDLEVGVADDAEQIRALDLRAREKLLDVGANDVLDEDEVDRAWPD